MERMNNRVALVTGGASGIGRATVERLVREGAKVAVADYNLEAAEKLAVALNADGEKVLPLYYDAADLDSGQAAVVRTLAHFGTIDVLVNNVGIGDMKRDVDVVCLDLDYFDEVMHTNLKSMLAISRTALPVMAEKKQGAIVNVSSIGSLMGDFRGTLYGLSKAGVNNLTRYIACQYGRSGIRCNAVASWLVLTPSSLECIPENLRQVFQKYNAVPYLGNAEDVAATIVFLASDDARYISGQTLVVDGGMSCHNPTIDEVSAGLSE